MVQGSDREHGTQAAATERAKRPGLAALLPPTLEEEAVIYAAFAVLEDNPAGSIDYYGAKAAIKGMGMAVTKRELLQAMEQCCSNSSEDRISRADFTAVAMRFLKRRSQEEQLQADMAIFDTQGKGFVDAGDLRRVTRRLYGTPAADEELSHMIRSFDSGGHGRLGAREFAAATGL